MPKDGRRPGGTSPSWAYRLARRLRSVRAVVDDRSMRPTLEPGDRLRVDPRAFAERPPARGDVVVLHDPERPGRLLVKRVVGVPGDLASSGVPVPAGHVTVEGDDPSSRDSRAFGAVAIDRLRGRVWYRYYPADRRRRFPP